MKNNQTLIMELKNLYVITGGPGVGKTTLINALNQRGYSTVPEEARKIIQQQTLTNADGVPWKNKTFYAQLMLEASIETFNLVIAKSSDEITFFDRGILDSICYMKMENIPILSDFENDLLKYRYNKRVFLLPPWLEIYETDNERKQTWEEAVYTYYKMKQTYLEYSYEIIEVPKVSIDERCDFIVTNVIKDL
ncbi:MAG TPA: AAA family ATPase [Sphingobacteriaceae bacterium]|nr:AAA family ATPase [Sphingobacteriaceae bacterium]